MKNSKFLLFAFVLLIVATPVLFAFAFDDDLPNEQNPKVVLVFRQEKNQNEDLTNVSDFKTHYYRYDFERKEPKIYTDAVDLNSQYHLINPTKAITVKDLSRNITPFRFYNQSNRKFIASNLYINSKGKV